MISDFSAFLRTYLFSFFFNFLVFFSLSPLLFSQFGQNAKHDNISGKLRTYSILNGPEKLYVFSDKERYTVGDVIWFKAYLLNGVTHKKSEKSSVIYVDLLNQNGDVVAHRKLFVREMGASGDIEINGGFASGRYRLRAYTQYMLNDVNPILFEKSIFIHGDGKLNESLTESDVSIEDLKSESNQSSQKISARFFPEGGNLISGVQNILGFEIKDESGNGILTDGIIQEANGTPVSYFKSHDFGLGIVNFTPEKGKLYYAVVEYGGTKQRFVLPEAMEKGYMLNVRNNGDHLIILASSTINKGLEDAFLVGHLRGDVFFEKRIKRPGNKNQYRYQLNTERLSDGVAHFTLFDKNGEPLCERLVFVDNPKDNAFLNIMSSKIDLDYREEFEVGLDISDDSEERLAGELSLSIFKMDDTMRPAHSDSHIKTWLLLNSDLGGTIPYASYFFEDDSGYRKRLLDALMLTHGWRRFVWKEFLVDHVAKSPKFEPEKGIMIKGTTTSANNNYKPLKSQIKLSFMGKEIHQEVKRTDARGKFEFGPFFFQDTISGVVEVMAKNRFERREVHVNLEPTPLKLDFDTSKYNEKEPLVSSSVPVIPSKITKSEVTEDFIIGSEVKRLKEVKLFGEEKTKRQLVDEEVDRFTALYSEPSHRVYVDSVPELIVHSAFDYLRRFPGIRVLGRYPSQSVTIQGQGSLTVNLGQEPLFLFDGAPVSAGFAASLTANEIMFVDVLKGAEATIFGVRGSNGVIAFYGKRGIRDTWSEQQSKGVASFETPGFYKTREYYSPDYSTPEESHKNPDYRTTLHWEPDIFLDGNEKVLLKQFTGDMPGEYMIKVEGITHDGQPVFNTSRISVGDLESSTIE